MSVRTGALKLSSKNSRGVLPAPLDASIGLGALTRAPGDSYTFGAVTEGPLMAVQADYLGAAVLPRQAKAPLPRRN